MTSEARTTDASVAATRGSLGTSRRRFRLLYVAPALAVIALMAWAFASPMGASPDDDFHLASIWCANASKTSDCMPGPTQDTRVVPESLIHSSCYIRKPSHSAACLYRDFPLNPTPNTTTDRGNFAGGYPPLYYATMNLFVGPNILLSIMIMRFANVFLFVGLGTALFLLLPRFRRPTLVWAWLVTTIPLGAFLIASNNPSAWAVMGIGTCWLALLGYFEAAGRRKIALGTLFVISTFMAAGARSDSAAYAMIAIGAVLFLSFEPTKKYFLSAIVPGAMVIVCVLYFFSANQYLSAVVGFTGGGGNYGLSGAASVAATAAALQDPVALVAYNLLNVPSLWAGVLGTWGLGWLDTTLPAIVWTGSIACFVCVAFVGFSRMTRRKSLVLAALGLALIVIPVYVLTKGGDKVGQEVQPRYLLPLIVLFAGVLLLSSRRRPLKFTRGQLMLIVITLSIVQFVSLQTNMRRYITGVNKGGWNLDNGVKWWWNIGVSPMFVLIVGSLAYAAVVAILVREVSGRRALASGMSSDTPSGPLPVEPVSSATPGTGVSSTEPSRAESHASHG